MVYARALRALECITHAGPSPALGTTSLSQIIHYALEKLQLTPLMVET
jgi:hypothetical protein